MAMYRIENLISYVLDNLKIRLPRREKKFNIAFITVGFIPCILNNKCLLYTSICTNKYCKFILNYSDMLRC